MSSIVVCVGCDCESRLHQIARIWNIYPMIDVLCQNASSHCDQDQCFETRNDYCHLTNRIVEAVTQWNNRHGSLKTDLPCDCAVRVCIAPSAISNQCAFHCVQRSTMNGTTMHIKDQIRRPTKENHKNIVEDNSEFSHAHSHNAVTDVVADM